MLFGDFSVRFCLFGYCFDAWLVLYDCLLLCFVFCLYGSCVVILCFGVLFVWVLFCLFDVVDGLLLLVVCCFFLWFNLDCLGFAIKIGSLFVLAIT